MPLIYCFVARDTTILAEYTHAKYQGNFNTIAIECLQKLNNPDSKFTITCDKHTFNFLIQNGFTYLAVADEKYGREIPFQFLERVQAEFEEKFADKGRASPAHSLDSTFGPRLQRHMEWCMQNPDQLSKTAAINKTVNEIKGVMIENIDKVLERGQKIELLGDKATELEDQANMFQKKGKVLRNKMWWQNCRMKLYIFSALIILAIVIFLIVCFGGGKNCTKRE